MKQCFHYFETVNKSDRVPILSVTPHNQGEELHILLFLCYARRPKYLLTSFSQDQPARRRVDLHLNY